MTTDPRWTEEQRREYQDLLQELGMPPKGKAGSPQNLRRMIVANEATRLLHQRRRARAEP